MFNIRQIGVFLNGLLTDKEVQVKTFTFDTKQVTIDILEYGKLSEVWVETLLRYAAQHVPRFSISFTAG